jgi:hypothetical protein
MGGYTVATFTIFAVHAWKMQARPLPMLDYSKQQNQPVRQKDFRRECA